MNDGTILRLLPVCECGYIFEGIEIKKNKSIIDGKYTISKYSFKPCLCPNCGKNIEGISINNDIFKMK